MATLKAGRAAGLVAVLLQHTEEEDSDTAHGDSPQSGQPLSLPWLQTVDGLSQIGSAVVDLISSIERSAVTL